MNVPRGYKAYELAQATRNDTKAQKYLKESSINMISRPNKRRNIMLDALKTLFENDVVREEVRVPN